MNIEDEALEEEILYMLKLPNEELHELRKSFVRYIQEIDQELTKRK